MKKLITFLSVCAMMLAYRGASAQCVINNSNFTPGFSPSSLTCIQQGTSYGQSVQMYAPPALGPATIDSIVITGITGLPTGISFSGNPSSGHIPGGGRGCIWFSGTTNDTVGAYVLTFSGTAYTNLGNLPLSSAPVNTVFTYTLNVCPAPISVCDTLFNLVSAIDTPEVYPVFDLQNNYQGFLSGTNGFGDLVKAEQFTAAIGAQVSGAFLSFGYVTINPSDSDNTVTVYAYADSSGSPGHAIDSATVTLRQIAEEVSAIISTGYLQYVNVSFNAGVALTSPTFYVGVGIPYLDGDTIALVTSNFDGGGDGLGWEQWNDGSWNSYDSVYGVPFGNFIAGVACVTGYEPLAAFSATPLSGCAGDTIQFADMSTYGTPTAWSWSFASGTPATSTSQNPKVSYAAAGSYNVKLIATNAFGSDTVIRNGYITIYPNPNASVITNTPASSSTATDGALEVNATSGTGLYTYNWNNSDTGATVSGLAAGSYVVTITDAHSCSYVSAPIVVTFTNGINGVAGNNQVKIYPNPASEQLNLQWNTAVNAEISIVDVNGKMVHQFVTNGKLVNTFDIHDLSSGSYVIHITDVKTKQQQSAIFNKL